MRPQEEGQVQLATCRGEAEKARRIGRGQLGRHVRWTHEEVDHLVDGQGAGTVVVQQRVQRFQLQRSAQGAGQAATKYRSSGMRRDSLWRAGDKVDLLGEAGVGAPARG